MLLIISRNEDRPELESKILAAAFRQSVENGDINGSRLAHRELVGLLARKSKAAANGGEDELQTMFASDNVTGMDLQALVGSRAAAAQLQKKAASVETNGAGDQDASSEWVDMSPSATEDNSVSDKVAEAAELLSDPAESDEAPDQNSQEEIEEFEKAGSDESAPELENESDQVEEEDKEEEEDISDDPEAIRRLLFGGGDEEAEAEAEAEEAETPEYTDEQDESDDASAAEPVYSGTVEASTDPPAADESESEFGSFSNKLGLESRIPEPEWDPAFNNTPEDNEPAPAADPSFVLRPDKITGSIKKPVIPKPPEPVSETEPESVHETTVEIVSEIDSENVENADLEPIAEDPPQPAIETELEPVSELAGEIQAKTAADPSVEPVTEDAEIVISETFDQGTQPVDYLDFGGSDYNQTPPAAEVYAQIDFGGDEAVVEAPLPEAPQQAEVYAHIDFGDDAGADAYAAPATISALLAQRPPPDPEAFGYYPWIAAEATDSAVVVHVCYWRSVRRMLMRQFGEDRTQALNPPVFKKQLRNMGVAYNILSDPVTRLDYDLRQLGLREPDAGSGLKTPAEARLPDAGGKVRIAFSELLILCRIFDADQMLAIVNAARLLTEEQFWNYLAESGLLTEVELDSIKSGFQFVCNGLISVIQFEQAFQYVRANQQELVEILLAASWVLLDDLYALNAAESAPEAPTFVEVEVDPNAVAASAPPAPPMPDWMDWGDSEPRAALGAAASAEAGPAPAAEQAVSDDLSTYLNASEEGVESLQAAAPVEGALPNSPEIPPVVLEPDVLEAVPLVPESAVPDQASPPALETDNAPDLVPEAKPALQEKPGKKIRGKGKAGKAAPPAVADAAETSASPDEAEVPSSLSDALLKSQNAEKPVDQHAIDSVPNSLFEALSAAKQMKESAKDKRNKYKKDKDKK